MTKDQRSNSDLQETPLMGFADLRPATLRHVAGSCATATITAPKSGGQLFLKGSPLFIETAWTDDKVVQSRLAALMRVRGRERKEAIWFRDAALCERVDGILFIGLKDWYPPVYDCGACGYATCAEYLDATTAQRGAAGEIVATGLQPTAAPTGQRTGGRHRQRRAPADLEGNERPAVCRG